MAAVEYEISVNYGNVIQLIFTVSTAVIIYLRRSEKRGREPGSLQCLAYTGG